MNQRNPKDSINKDMDWLDVWIESAINIDRDSYTFSRSLARHFCDPQTWTSLALRLKIDDKTGTLAYPVWCIVWVVWTQLFAKTKCLTFWLCFSDLAIQTPTVVESVLWNIKPVFPWEPLFEHWLICTWGTDDAKSNPNIYWLQVFCSPGK